MKIAKYLNGTKKAPGYAIKWAKEHPWQAGAAATAGAALVHTALNSTGYNGPGILDNYPALRFPIYIGNALATAELNKQRVAQEKGRDLSFGERMSSSLYGSIAPMLLWEGWEEAGSAEPVYKILSRAFGEMAKQDFPGKGSFVDLGLTVGAVMAVELGKEGIQLARRLGRNKHK